MYWSRTGNSSTRTVAPRSSLAVVDEDAARASGGALNGISISMRPVVPSMCIRWYGTSCVEHVNVAWPDGKSRIADASRSTPKSGSRSSRPITRVGSSPNSNRDIVIG